MAEKAETIIQVNFDGAPPAQGGGGTDWVPPGTYKLEVINAEARRSQAGRRMVSARFKIVSGRMTGKNIADNFALEGESNFGIQRFHAFMLALAGRGLDKPLTGSKSIDLSTIKGRQCYAELTDNVIPPSEKYPQRTVSRPVAFYPVNDADQDRASALTEQMPITAAPVAALPAPAPAANGAAAPVPEDAGSDDLFEGAAEAAYGGGADVATAPAAEAPAATQTAPAAVESADDLFD